ncbi:3-hydroxyacyl-CoA dehydrogenase NAD-binding domain-containing protein [Candidatus Poriferisodalis sp.]|uniref:3-hydroxyacyl-CoA dehydrogenase NAD-binding domain-containing protein n=1 Tax=Candidatus Poriferisodalis sp. TaxID=3101277 RepID=UPI003B0255E8
MPTGRPLASETEPADRNLPARVCVVGAGVIGSAWAARWALCGADVTVADPSPSALRSVEQTLEAASVAWRQLGLLGRGQPSLRSDDSMSDGDAGTSDGERSATSRTDGTESETGGSLGTVTLAHPAKGCSAAAVGAELIHECVPERLATKQAVYAEIEAAASAEAVIASSTSGIRPSDLQEGMEHPGRLIVGHPFNPVYLLPLVEVVGGTQTSEHAIDQATAWFAAAGMSPLRIRTEIDGFVADRLLEALWREALWLVHDGVATVSEIDDAMRLGFGLRWAQMGVFQTYATAGGEGGFRHFIEHFTPTLDLPWTKLTDVPKMTPEFIATLVAQSDQQSAGQTAAELCAARDRNLADMLLTLEANDWGAGHSLAALRRRLGSAQQQKRS